MSTELAVLPRSGFMALSEGSAEVREAMDAVAGVETFSANDLSRVKTPTGGSVTWEVPDGVGGSDSTKVITGILCYVQKSGVLWPSEEQTAGQLPVLRTFDLKVAEQIGPIPDDMIDTLNRHKIPGTENKYYWEQLPWNQFGSGKNGQGKRCKEQRLLFILRAGDIYPLVVPVQPGSLSNFRRFFLNLPRIGVPYWGCVINLGLEKATNRGGKDFARIVPSVAGKVDDETRAMIKRNFTDRLQIVAAAVVDETLDEVAGDLDE